MTTGLFRLLPQKRHAAASDAGGHSTVARSNWLAPMRAVGPLDLPHSPGANRAITQGDKLRETVCLPGGRCVGGGESIQGLGAARPGLRRWGIGMRAYDLRVAPGGQEGTTWARFWAANTPVYAGEKRSRRCNSGRRPHRVASARGGCCAAGRQCVLRQMAQRGVPSGHSAGGL